MSHTYYIYAYIWNKHYILLYVIRVSHILLRCVPRCRFWLSTGSFPSQHLPRNSFVSTVWWKLKARSPGFVSMTNKIPDVKVLIHCKKIATIVSIGDVCWSATHESRLCIRSHGSAASMTPTVVLVQQNLEFQPNRISKRMQLLYRIRLSDWGHHC